MQRASLSDVKKNPDLIHFFAGGDLEQLAGDLLLHAQQNSVGCQNSDADAGVADGLNGVLHLIKTPFWRESGCPRIVAPCLEKTFKIARKIDMRRKNNEVEKRGRAPLDFFPRQFNCHGRFLREMHRC